MSTTAEGVESELQVRKLREACCTQIQGYVFSPPRPASEIATMFAERAKGAMDAPAETGKIRASTG
jgi:EAL domain-containing protein (putative c-di-GMP-specific phosphodiesterase class I)